MSKKVIEAYVGEDNRPVPSGVGDIVKYKGNLYHRADTNADGDTLLYGIDTTKNLKVLNKDSDDIKFVKRDYEWGHEYYYGC